MWDRWVVRIPALCDLWSFHSAYKLARPCRTSLSVYKAKDLAKIQESSWRFLCFLLCLAPSSLAPSTANFYGLSNPQFQYLYSLPSKADLGTTSLWGSLKSHGESRTCFACFPSLNHSPCFILFNAENLYFMCLSCFSVIYGRRVNMKPTIQLWLNFQRTNGSQPLCFFCATVMCECDTRNFYILSVASIWT